MYLWLGSEGRVRDCRCTRRRGGHRGVGRRVRERPRQRQALLLGAGPVAAGNGQPVAERHHLPRRQRRPRRDRRPDEAGRLPRLLGRRVGRRLHDPRHATGSSTPARRSRTTSTRSWPTSAAARGPPCRRSTAATSPPARRAAPASRAPSTSRTRSISSRASGPTRRRCRTRSSRRARREPRRRPDRDGGAAGRGALHVRPERDVHHHDARRARSRPDSPPTAATTRRRRASNGLGNPFRIEYSFIPWQNTDWPGLGQGCGLHNVNATSNAFGNGIFDSWSIVVGHEYSEAVTDPDNFFARPGRLERRADAARTRTSARGPRRRTSRSAGTSSRCSRPGATRRSTRGRIPAPSRARRSIVGRDRTPPVAAHGALAHRWPTAAYTPGSAGCRSGRTGRS